jgi:hypothetical protein
MKEIMAQDTMLTYPQFDKPLIVYTDASEKQIGGIVTQAVNLKDFSARNSLTPTLIPSHRTRVVSNSGGKVF